MAIRIKRILATALLSLAAGHATVSQAQQMGGGGAPPPGGAGGPPPTGSPDMGPGRMTTRDFIPPDAGRVPGVPDARSQPGGQPEGSWGGRSSLPGAPPEMPSQPRVVTPKLQLGNVVSMVQERFNATAVKTDTVTRGGRVMYRIRLLSADKSRVWTVNVDASTGAVD